MNSKALEYRSFKPHHKSTGSLTNKIMAILNFGKTDLQIDGLALDGDKLNKELWDVNYRNEQHDC